jgi:hypothetical protein
MEWALRARAGPTLLGALVLRLLPRLLDRAVNVANKPTADKISGH